MRASRPSGKETATDMTAAIFAYIAFAIITLSILVISRRNPVHSVMLMLLLFFHIAAMYIFLNAEFMAAIQIIVYAGAILVLFLFVVFLLNLREEVAERRFMGIWAVGLAIVFALSLTVFASLKNITVGPQGAFGPDVIAAETHTVAIGKVLYTEFLFPFEIASLILLVAIIGAIVLAKKRVST